MENNSRAESAARTGFRIFNNHRMLFGFSALLILTACSIYFNVRLGQLNATMADSTTKLAMPTSYGFLDVANMVLLMCLFAGVIRSVFLWVASVIWAGYLTALSLFACLSCIIALDAINASSGDDFKRQQLQLALDQANESVKTWQDNVERTTTYKSRFQGQLDNAIENRDSLTRQIAKLDAVTPPAQKVFEVMEPLLPAWMDKEQFRLWARMAFGVAMIITPLLLTGVLAHVFGRREEEAVSNQGGNEKGLGKPETEQESPASDQSADELIAEFEQQEGLRRVEATNGDEIWLPGMPADKYPIMDNCYTEETAYRQQATGSADTAQILPFHSQKGLIGSVSGVNQAKPGVKPGVKAAAAPTPVRKKQAAKSAATPRKSTPRKQQGVKHESYARVKNAILSGPEVVPSYKALKGLCAPVGESQIRKVLADLAGQGLVYKDGQKWKRRVT